MRVIYWFYDVTSETLGFVFGLMIVLPIIALEKLGVIKLDQSYQDKGKVDL